MALLYLAGRFCQLCRCQCRSISDSLQSMSPRLPPTPPDFSRGNTGRSVNRIFDVAPRILPDSLTPHHRHQHPPTRRLPPTSLPPTHSSPLHRPSPSDNPRPSHFQPQNRDVCACTCACAVDRPRFEEYIFSASSASLGGQSYIFSAFSALGAAFESSMRGARGADLVARCSEVVGGRGRGGRREREGGGTVGGMGPGREELGGGVRGRYDATRTGWSGLELSLSLSRLSVRG